MRLCGIISRFQLLSPCMGQVIHALLTRPPLSPPLASTEISASGSSFDLHVLGTPPAFILSQDRTLKLISFKGFRLSFLSGNRTKLRFILSVILRVAIISNSFGLSLNCSLRGTSFHTLLGTFRAALLSVCHGPYSASLRSAGTRLLRHSSLRSS